jgi:hypothetical protein
MSKYCRVSLETTVNGKKKTMVKEKFTQHAAAVDFRAASFEISDDGIGENFPCLYEKPLMLLQVLKSARAV